MKYIKLYILQIVALSLLILPSCENEIGQMVPADAVSPSLTGPASGMVSVLSKVNELDSLTSFVWNNADFKMDVQVIYNLEVDVASGDYSVRKVMFNNISSPYTVTVGDFNKALLANGFLDGVAHDVKFRIVASNFLASGDVTMNVTPYFDAEPWSVIGSAVGGWDPQNDQFMDYDKNTATYSLTLDLTPGEFKFRASKKDKTNPWAFNLGLDGDSKEYEDAVDVALKADGANIKTKGGNYTLTLDVVKNIFSIVQNSAPDLTDWTGVVLDAVGTGVSADNATAITDPSGWGWGNVVYADNDGKPVDNTGVYTWTWTDIVLEANEGFKIRTKNGEAPPVNGNGFDVGFSAVDVANSTDKVADKDGNISVTEKGTYIMSITIDALSGDVKTVTITVPGPKYPTSLYMIGDGVGDWDWANTDLPMIPVNSHPNAFWKIVWMNATGGFKMAPVKEWNGDFGVEDDSYTGPADYKKGGKNIPVPGTAGYYMVWVDLDKDSISVTEANVYLMGSTVGGWDTAKPENKFTVDNANGKLTDTRSFEAGELRMYVWHKWATDWWQNEFIILNGKIEYRGTGGDQERVNVSAGSHTIDLNFKTGEGSIL